MLLCTNISLQIFTPISVKVSVLWGEIPLLFSKLIKKISEKTAACIFRMGITSCNLKIYAACFSNTLVFACQILRHKNPEDSKIHFIVFEKKIDQI
jgi:hypothetical protein